MPEELIRLQIGDMLQLQHAPPSTNPERYPVRVVGYHSGDSLIITTPRHHGKALLLREGQRFTVRMLLGGTAFAFVSSVLQPYVRPFPHVHLSYPEEVESIKVRNARRVFTELPASIRATELPDSMENYRPVTIVDLSSSGARMLSDHLIANAGDLVHIKLAVSVCEVSELVDIIAVVRNLKYGEREDGGVEYCYGVQFRPVNRFHQVLLCGYVLELLVEQR